MFSSKPILKWISPVPHFFIFHIAKIRLPLLMIDSGDVTTLKVMLRYVKVNAIRDATVSMTGINPLTGTHITYMFECKNKPMLRKLKLALEAKIFIKVSTGAKKGRLHSRFESEDPPETRKDSYFTLFSFASKSGYNPKFLRELDHHLVTMDDWISPFKELGKYLLNATDKLGMVYYAKEQIVKLKKSKRPYMEARYHITNAIISSKACLDALATILNQVYGIGYRRGQIDFATARSDLLHQIGKVNRKLGSLLRKYERWINDITDYRDSVIHKIMLVTHPIGPISDPSGLISKPISVKVPSRPLTTGYLEQEKVDWLDAEDYCQRLIERLQTLIEIVCVDLLRLIKSKTYFPI